MKKAHTFELAIVLLIVILACILYIVITSKPSQSGGWESSFNQTSDYILPGSDGMLYTFSRNNVTAIDSNGEIAWKFDAQQDIWGEGSGGYGIDAGGSLIRFYHSTPKAAERSGHLYLLARKTLDIDDIRKACANNKTTIELRADLISLSPRGEVEWIRVINGSLPAEGFSRVLEEPYCQEWLAGFTYSGVSSLTASGDRIYVFHDGQEDVLDANGTLIYTLQGLSSAPVVDDRSYIYAVLAAPNPDVPRTQPSIYVGNSPSAYLGYVYAYLAPSNIIAAYMPDGTQAWSLDLGERATPISVGTLWHTDFVSRLFFANHTLYVPVQNGVAAVSTDGRMLWVRHPPGDSYTLFESMPIDPSGNVYFQQDRPIAYIYTISSDGQVQTSPMAFNFWSGEEEPGSKTPVFLDGKDGIVYGTGSTTYMSPVQFNETYESGHFDPGQVTAYDLAHNTTLWTFAIPAEDTHAILLTPENYVEAISKGWGADIHPNNAGVYTSITQDRIIDVNPGRDVTYVSYEYTIREDPIVLNQSRGMYVRELYALDNSGRLLWKKPVGPIKLAVVSNDTIYYSTWEGQMGGGASIAGGIAIFATLYLILRFIGVGAVSRARNVLHINENRNDLISYIADNPGSTAMEIARGLKMNLGTLRYHLLILSMNHKIVIHQDGDKYVRYFKNSGAYTPEERILLSLIHREPILRTLEVLSKNPGMSVAGLAEELSVSDTAMNRHVKVLVEQGIVNKTLVGDKSYAHTIKDEYKDTIIQTIERERFG